MTMQNYIGRLAINEQGELGCVTGYNPVRACWLGFHQDAPGTRWESLAPRSLDALLAEEQSSLREGPDPALAIAVRRVPADGTRFSLVIGDKSIPVAREALQSLTHFLARQLALPDEILSPREG
jgi:hypothetical protein